MKIADTYACCLCAVSKELCRDLEGCCTSLPQERSNSCQSININIFPIPRESSFFLAKSPFGAMGGEVAVGYVPSLWEGAMESLTWAEGSGKPAHLGVVFCCQAVFTFHTEKSMSCKGKHSKTLNSYDTWALSVKTKQGVGVVGHA